MLKYYDKLYSPFNNINNNKRMFYNIQNKNQNYQENKYVYKGPRSLNIGNDQLPSPISETSIQIDTNDMYNPNNTGSFLRVPTTNNPMMNVPIYAYDRPEAYSDYDRYDKYRDTRGQVTKDNAEKDLSSGLYQDPADYFFKRNASERQFFSVPVGGNMADTVEFAENLYGTKYNCKNGSIYMNQGVLYTDDSLHCVPGIQVSTPTGFGNIR